MNAQDVCDALRRYLNESENDPREIATKIGVSWIILSAWLAGEAEASRVKVGSSPLTVSITQ